MNRETVEDALAAHVRELARAEGLQLESLVAEAVILQDYDRLDHLCIVAQFDLRRVIPRTVASTRPEPNGPWPVTVA